MVRGKMTDKERLDDMLERYGEVCKMSVAARILGRSPATISHMLKDGRLDYACGGEMVDMRSVVRYIQRPKEVEFEYRARKYKEKYDSDYVVV